MGVVPMGWVVLVVFVFFPLGLGVIPCGVD